MRCKTLLSLFSFILSIIGLCCGHKLPTEINKLSQYCGNGDCLIEAAYINSLDIVKELLKNNIENATVHEQRGGRTALHRVGYESAVRSKHGAAATALTISRLLINQGDAEIDETDFFGWTAMMFQASTGYAPVVEYLAKQGADLEAVEQEHGRTALFFAVLNGHYDVVKILLRHGASADKADKYGWKPLHLAISNGRKEGWDRMAILLMDEGGADPNGVLEEPEERTALILAVQSAAPRMVRLLVEKGAEISKPDKDGREPITWAGIQLRKQKAAHSRLQKDKKTFPSRFKDKTITSSPLIEDVYYLLNELGAEEKVKAFNGWVAKQEMKMKNPQAFEGDKKSGRTSKQQQQQQQQAKVSKRPSTKVSDSEL